MIESIIIINAGGVCIYNKNFTVSKMDEQLLSGFLIAVSNFSKEVMSEGELQKIDAKDQKIVSYVDKDTGLTIAAIADALDYDGLLLKILRKILKEFDKKYHNVLDDPKISQYNQKFDSIAREIIDQSVSNRGKSKIILGLFVGIILVILLFDLQSIMLFIFADNYFSSLGPATGPLDVLIPFAVFSLEMQLIGFLSFAPSGFVTGYIAGSRKRGLYIGFILSFSLLAYSIISLIVSLIIFHKFNLIILNSLGLFILLVTYLPLIIVITFVFSYIGGLLKDKNKLYPLPPEKAVHIDL
ncbi:MAG: hypothetical protein ACTSQO_11625 [Candidatus Helarchaeota archaeon]